MREEEWARQERGKLDIQVGEGEDKKHRGRSKGARATGGKG